MSIFSRLHCLIAFRVLSQTQQKNKLILFYSELESIIFHVWGMIIIIIFIFYPERDRDLYRKS